MTLFHTELKYVVMTHILLLTSRLTDYLSRFEGISTIALYVGISAVPFQVHENLLFGMSPVLKAAFTSEFKEASERCMKFPEDNADTFELFLRWLYTADIEPFDVSSKASSTTGFLQLAELYVLADKLDVGLLKNDIIDRMFEIQAQTSKNPPQHNVVSYIYLNSTRQSAFRKLLVDWHVWHIDYQWYCDKDRAEQIYAVPEFGADLAVRLGQKMNITNLRGCFAGKANALYETAWVSTEDSKETCLVQKEGWGSGKGRLGNSQWSNLALGDT